MSIKISKSNRSVPDWEAFFFGNGYKESRILKIVRLCKFIGISISRYDSNDNPFTNEIFRPIASEVELERRIVERLNFYAIVTVMFLQLLETCINFLM